MKSWWRTESRRIPDLQSYIAKKEGNGDGSSVTRRTFREILMSLGAPIHESEWILLLDYLDNRRQGRIDIPNFMSQIGWESKNKAASARLAIRNKLRSAVYLKDEEIDIRLIFSDYDYNNSGNITRREFQGGLAKIGVTPSSDELLCLMEVHIHFHIHLHTH